MTGGATYRRRWVEEGRITPFQKTLLAWLQDYVARTGHGPTSVQVRDALRLGRTTWQHHLMVLERGGFIRRTVIEVVRGPGRGLTAREAAWCQANPDRVRAMMAIAGEVP